MKLGNKELFYKKYLALLTNALKYGILVINTGKIWKVGEATLEITESRTVKRTFILPIIKSYKGILCETVIF